MTDQTGVTYVAQITLSLPGQPERATAIVTLAPTDKIAAGGQAKPLSECTPAELVAYSKALEAEVWDAYEAISLLELREEAEIDIRVVALDATGQPTEEIVDWSQQVILLDRPTTAPLVELPVPPSPKPAVEVEVPATLKQAVEQEVLPTSKPAVEMEVPPTPKPAVELEVPPTSKQDAEPEVPAAAKPAVELEVPPTPKPATPAIIPSQARVRVAGGRLPLAESGGAAVDILLDEAPLRAMQAHALSSLDREVAGVMVGRQPEKQPDGRYVVHVIDSIVAKHTVMQGASVTYTPESWRYMTDTLWERYPDESAVIVGWYHTHPGFGIFLSGMDLFIHQNFFTQLWHVAYVLDPRARSSGFFAWNRQKTKVNRYDFMWPDWAEGSW